MDEHAERLRKAFLDAWNIGETRGFEELLHPHYRRRGDAYKEPGRIADLFAAIASTREAFPDLVSSVEDIVVGENQIAMRWVSEGTHTGRFMGVPATLKPVRVSGVTFSRFEGDVIVEEWVTWQERELLNSVGVLHVGEE